jgi:anion-transporting  ArsA/GET3 family ATPase
MSLSGIVGERRIAITVGPGGVGKTTVAAMLGLQAAVRGRRALVLTIDPAMRLAEALGLTGLAPGKRRTLSVDELKRQGVPARAPLTAVMLDTGKSLTDLIIREVPSDTKRERILRHPFFQRLCDDLAGSREYAAMEELYHLHTGSGFDLVVVDTPPTTHSLQFIDAPDRILDVLEHGSYRWLMRPALLAGKIGLKVLDFSGGYVVRTLSRFTGLEFLKELATFVDLFSGLMEGFRQRAAALKDILRSEACAFVLVTTADSSQASEATYLCRRLSNRDLSPDALVANRVALPPDPLPGETGWKEEMIGSLANHSGQPRELVARCVEAMIEAHGILDKMATRDQQNLLALSRSLDSGRHLSRVPLLPRDVHDIPSLEEMRRLAFDSKGGSP